MSSLKSVGLKNVVRAAPSEGTNFTAQLFNLLYFCINNCYLIGQGCHTSFVFYDRSV